MQKVGIAMLSRGVNHAWEHLLRLAVRRNLTIIAEDTVVITTPAN